MECLLAAVPLNNTAVRFSAEKSDLHHARSRIGQRIMSRTIGTLFKTHDKLESNCLAIVRTAAHQGGAVPSELTSCEDLAQCFEEAAPLKTELTPGKTTVSGSLISDSALHVGFS